MASTSTSNQSISSFQCPFTFDFDPTNVTHFPVLVFPSWVSLAVINAITAPPTVLINVLVIWTVMENEILRSNNYYLLVAILSFSDLLVGLIVQPLFIALIVGIILQYSSLCHLTIASMSSASLCYGWTVATMAILSLERYLFIEHPLYYQNSITSKKVIILTAASWILVGILKLPIRYVANSSFWARQLPSMILTTGPSIIIILFCVTKINLTAHRHIRVIVAQQQAVAQRSKTKEIKRTFTLGLVALASVACFCPMLVMKIVGAVWGNWSNDFKYVSQGIYLTVLHLQSIINPIIYSLRLSDIRSGVTKKLCCNRP